MLRWYLGRTLRKQAQSTILAARRLLSIDAQRQVANAVLSAMNDIKSLRDKNPPDFEQQIIAKLRAAFNDRHYALMTGAVDESHVGWCVAHLTEVWVGGYLACYQRRITCSAFRSLEDVYGNLLYMTVFPSNGR